MSEKDNLSEGELEDGEVLSSEEEEEGPESAKVCKEKAPIMTVVGHHFPPLG